MITNVKKYTFPLAWILYCVLFLVTMYAERVLFSDSFKELSDYLLIGGIWFGVFLVAIIVGKNLPIKFLTLIIFLGAIGLSLLWFYFSFQLRVYNTTDYKCSTWDCEVKNEIGGYCDSWVCQMVGQSILFIVQFAIILPFLIYWTQKRQMKNANNLSLSLLLMGVFLLTLAGIHELEYYLAFYLVAILWIVFAIAMIPALKTTIKLISDTISTTGEDSQKESPRFHIDLWRMWSNLIIILFMALFGFSLLDGEKIHYELTLALGIGVCFSAIVWYFMETQQESLTTAIDRFEVIIYLIIMASVVQGFFFFSAEPEVEFIAGMSSGIVGMIFGYIFVRIMAMLDQQYQPIGQFFIPLPRKLRGFLNMMILGIVFMILYVVGMIEIHPEVEAAYIVYGITLGVSFIGFILSITRHHKVIS